MEEGNGVCESLVRLPGQVAGHLRVVEDQITQHIRPSRLDFCPGSQRVLAQIFVHHLPVSASFNQIMPEGYFSQPARARVVATLGKGTNLPTPAARAVIENYLAEQAKPTLLSECLLVWRPRAGTAEQFGTI